MHRLNAAINSALLAQVRLLDIEDAGRRHASSARHIDAVLRRVDIGGVADDVDQPVERMQAAQQIVVLAVGARQERGKMAEADAFEAREPVEPASTRGHPAG